ncbi:hypothetical protein KC319_g13138 [Hortaea werneckii]|nr:hypothetical protein KC352_g25517 [Hortaea werneckii]KAI7552992.1 hypothetical protein KC317_g13608 [Hortaea werneckii]KAI7599882.1 hypothetical protein KC346_g13522 [Hortaea werneckii]KAI7642225.1 hypothetical protein KC319_g13138 [Hortaea werneckii]
MGAATRKPQQGSVLALFAGKRSTPDQVSTSKSKAPHHHWHHPPRLGPALQKVWHPGNVLEREVTWPTDSFQDQSLDENEDDIWLTSGTDDDGKNLRRRRLATMQQRPPARQTSRSRVDSKGTYSTTGKPPSPQTENPQQLPQSMDGSTESEAYRTARSHVSPTGDLIVDSSDVRQLFPHTSSLSPKRHPTSPRNRVGKPTPIRHERALQEITSNTLTRRQHQQQQQQRQQQKSPWKRAEAAAKKKEHSPAKHAPSEHNAPAGGKEESVLASSAALVRSPPIHCFKCADTAARVADLEDEVARLKGEVVALKAAMRRGGVALPPTVRGVR